MRQHIRQNAMKLDSLEYEQAIRDQYFDNLKRIISGEMPETILNDTTGMIDSQDITFHTFRQRFTSAATGGGRGAVQIKCAGRRECGQESV